MEDVEQKIRIQLLRLLAQNSPEHGVLDTTVISEQHKKERQGKERTFDESVNIYFQFKTKSALTYSAL